MTITHSSSTCATRWRRREHRAGVLRPDVLARHPRRRLLRGRIHSPSRALETGGTKESSARLYPRGPSGARFQGLAAALQRGSSLMDSYQKLRAVNVNDRIEKKNGL